LDFLYEKEDIKGVVINIKLERLISMIYMLLNNEVISASALADKYQVSQRTIYRDIDAICAAGIPVVSYQGVNGGYGIIETYKMDKSLLGSTDIGPLITILHSLSTLFDDEQAMDTARKLQTIQRDEDASILSMDIGSRQASNASLRLLRAAITTWHVVRFTYINGKNERSVRSVEPASLKYKNNAWYVYGYCRERKDYREFKLSRMTDLISLPEQFQRKHDVPLGRTSFENVETTNPVNVVLHFSIHSLARALDYFYDGEKSFHPDGSLTITFKIRTLEEAGWLIPVLLSFGERVEVVEPLAIRQELKITIERMLKRYS
jgi:predicted DNA-binding transcriptional regulator YafY